MIEISEIFHAPQGEGPFLGRQMLLVRVNKCPLSCLWCDTSYTWNKSHPDYGKGVKNYEPQDLASEMIRMSEEFVDWAPMSVSFTGGEPMIYQKDLPLVIDLFRTRFRIPIEVETAGTIVPNYNMLSRCHFNVSPKLSSAGNEKVDTTKLWNREATEKYAIVPTNTFKLVVGEGDEPSLARYLDWLRIVTSGLIPWHRMRERVYLMPEGVTAERIAARQGPVIELAQKYGVCVTTRMHITAFGDRRRT